MTRQHSLKQHQADNVHRGGVYRILFCRYTHDEPNMNKRTRVFHYRLLDAHLHDIAATVTVTLPIGIPQDAILLSESVKLHDLIHHAAMLERQYQKT